MTPEPTIRINVDVTNPGQFFACCGLLELADRLWHGAEGWFDESLLSFNIARSGTLEEFIEQILTTNIEQVDLDSDTSTPIYLGAPFHLLVDWWKSRPNSNDLKVWAGTMRSWRIACAMRDALASEELSLEDILNFGCIVFEKDNPKKKVEPYYFDARRGPSSDSLDVGFSANAHKYTTVAHPAVEFLCIIGLQRCFPSFTKTPRVFEYSVWTTPIQTSLTPALVSGEIKSLEAVRLRFENAYRTNQRKHKSFLPAMILTKDN